MKEAVINEIILEMQSKVDNGQLIKLKSALERIFYKYEIKEKIDFEDTEISNASYIELFLSAKKIEGCSLKSIKYYNATISNMLKIVNKNIKQIVTDDSDT